MVLNDGREKAVQLGEVEVVARSHSLSRKKPAVGAAGVSVVEETVHCAYRPSPGMMAVMMVMRAVGDAKHESAG